MSFRAISEVLVSCIETIKSEVLDKLYLLD